MAFDLSQLGGILAGAGGTGAGLGGAGEGLLGGKPGLLDLIPAFQFQNDKFSVNFDPQKEKRRRALMRLVEQQAGQRVPEVTTPTALGLGSVLGGSGGGVNLFTPRGAIPGAGGQGGIPGFRGLEPNLFPELFKDIPGSSSTLLRGGL